LDFNVVRGASNPTALEICSTTKTRNNRVRLYKSFHLSVGGHTWRSHKAQSETPALGNSFLQLRLFIPTTKLLVVTVADLLACHPCRRPPNWGLAGTSVLCEPGIPVEQRKGRPLTYRSIPIIICSIMLVPGLQFWSPFLDRSGHSIQAFTCFALPLLLQFGVLSVCAVGQLGLSWMMMMDLSSVCRHKGGENALPRTPGQLCKTLYGIFPGYIAGRLNE
jgi:hypothetical protein